MNSFAPVLIQIIFALLFTIVALGVTALIGPRKRNPVKYDAYECGVEYFNDARGIFNIKFYLVAVLFILFDVEAVFVIPWAVSFLKYKSLGLGIFIFLEMTVFMSVLIAGYIYIIKKGALEWE